MSTLPRDLTKLDLVRRAELSTDVPFVTKPANTLLRTKRIPMRRIDCYCGWVWWSHVVLDAPGNLCPKCERGASENRAGPVVHQNVEIPINVSAR